MKLTSEKAYELLNKAEKNSSETRWIHHSRCVGETASVIAKALNLDEEKAKTLGLIHDIGKMNGDFKNHIMNGYKYLKELGYDDEYCNICLTHSYLNNDCMCTAGGVPDDIPFRTEFIKNHEYTIYEKIINLCDLMCTIKPMILEQRLIEIMTRRGCHENTVYHITEAKKLKKFFDDKLGYNVYKLFPDLHFNY